MSAYAVMLQLAGIALWWTHMFEKALEIATRVTNPYACAALGMIICVWLLSLALKSRKGTVKGLFYAVLVVTFLLGITPLSFSFYLQARGVYRVNVEVIGADQKPVDNAELVSLPPALIKKVEGGWELETPPQTHPSDGDLVITASVPNAYLSGSAKVRLEKEYYLTVSIPLHRLPSVLVRGTVVDAHGNPVAGASVAIEGYSEVTKTNEMGSFQLQSHYAGGEQLTIIAKKGGVSAKKSGPAGDGFELVLK